MLPLSGVTPPPAMTCSTASSAASRLASAVHHASTPRVAHHARPAPHPTATQATWGPAAPVASHQVRRSPAAAPQHPGSASMLLPGLLHARAGALSLAGSSLVGAATSSQLRAAVPDVRSGFNALSEAAPSEAELLSTLFSPAPSSTGSTLADGECSLRSASSVQDACSSSYSSPIPTPGPLSTGQRGGSSTCRPWAAAGCLAGRAAAPSRAATPAPGGVAAAAMMSLGGSLPGCGPASSPATSVLMSAASAAGSGLAGRHRPLSTGPSGGAVSAAAPSLKPPAVSSPVVVSAAGSDAAKASKKQKQPGAQGQGAKAGSQAAASQSAAAAPGAAAPAFIYSPLHYNIEDFCSRVVPTEGEKRVRMEVVEAVRAGVRKVWPGARSVELQVFGSFANGLSTWNSDLDLVVTGVMSPDRLTGGYEPHDRAKITAKLRKVADALNRNRDIDIERTQLIPRARMPLLKLWTKNRVCVDVSMSDDSGPKAARYMSQQCRAFPPLKPLVLVLKMYLKACRLNEVNTGGLSSYSLTNMVIAHLQEELKSGHDIADLGETLYTFLLRYGEEHDYGSQAVSVASGGIVPKMSLGFAMESARQAAASMGSYDGAVNWNERLCVDCPLTGRDVSNGTYRIDLVRDAFVQAARKLEALARGRRISDTSLNYLQALFDVSRVLKRNGEAFEAPYEDEYLRIISGRGGPADDEEGEELSLSPADSGVDGEGGFSDADDLDGDYMERQPAGSATSSGAAGGGSSKGGQRRR